MTIIHNTNWTIDTSDWINIKDADKCAELIINKLKQLPPNVIQKAHIDFMSMEDYDETTLRNLSSEWSQVCDLCLEAQSEIFASYYGFVDSGHNAFAYPINE